MILQTSVKISIFLQDRYDPIAHGILGCVFELRWGASGDTTTAAELVVTMWTELFFSFFFAVVANGANTSPPLPFLSLPIYKPAIRLFTLET